MIVGGRPEVGGRLWGTCDKVSVSIQYRRRWGTREYIFVMLIRLVGRLKIREEAHQNPGFLSIADVTIMLLLAQVGEA